MAMVTKYVPVWKIRFMGRDYGPGTGNAPTVIEGLPDDEIARLLNMGAIRKLEYEDGSGGLYDSFEYESMPYNDLRKLAAERGLTVLGNPTKPELIVLLKEGGQGDA